MAASSAMCVPRGRLEFSQAPEVTIVIWRRIVHEIFHWNPERHRCLWCDPSRNELTIRKDLCMECGRNPSLNVCGSCFRVARRERPTTGGCLNP